MSIDFNANADIIGRAEINDIDAILAIPGTDPYEVEHVVKDNADAIFTWDYEKGARPALNKLYEKAKVSQWNGETDLDWSINVDQEAVVVANMAANNRGVGLDVTGTCFEKWGDNYKPQHGTDPLVLKQMLHERVNV